MVQLITLRSVIFFIIRFFYDASFEELMIALIEREIFV